MLCDMLIRPALDGYPVAYFGPNYSLLLEAWRSLNHTLSPIMKRTNANEHRMELITGGMLDFWTLDNPDAGRSRKYKRVIIDEAGLVKRLMEAWHAAIRPTLADLSGDAWLSGTPKGRNGFWELWSWEGAIHRGHTGRCPPTRIRSFPATRSPRCARVCRRWWSRRRWTRSSPRAS